MLEHTQAALEHDKAKLDSAIEQSEAARNTCEFCSRVATERRAVHVADDVDDDGNAAGYRTSVWLCQQHLGDYEMGEGMFDPLKAL